MTYAVITAFILMIMSVEADYLRIKVGIVGGGAAGLVAAKVLSDHHIHCIIYEKSDHIGGVWKYKPKNKCSSYDNPMYKSLRTNLPVEIMSYCQSFPIYPQLTSYLGHEDIQSYLEHFADHNNLSKYIKLDSEVMKIEKVAEQQTWLIECKDTLHDTDVHTQRVDYVIICNGHFSVPYIPSIRGLDRFPGISMHSSHYDSINGYDGKRVLIVGTKSSGTDMAYDVSTIASIVYVCDRQISVSSFVELNPKLIIVPDISHIDESGAIIFIDGMKVEVDYIIWCTGYQYSFPFLKPSTYTNIDVNSEDIHVIEGRAVVPLYHHLYCTHDPTIMFMGLPYSVIPFPLMYLQACWIAAWIAGRCQLPSPNQLHQWFDYFTHNQSSPGSSYACIRNYHNLGGDAQFEYMRHMAQEAGILDESLSRYLALVEEIYYDNSAHKPSYPGAPPSYRNRKYIINWEDYSWTVMPVLT